MVPTLQLPHHIDVRANQLSPNIFGSLLPESKISTATIPYSCLIGGTKPLLFSQHKLSQQSPRGLFKYLTENFFNCRGAENRTPTTRPPALRTTTIRHPENNRSILPRRYHAPPKKSKGDDVFIAFTVLCPKDVILLVFSAEAGVHDAKHPHIFRLCCRQEVGRSYLLL